MIKSDKEHLDRFYTPKEIKKTFWQKVIGDLIKAWGSNEGWWFGVKFICAVLLVTAAITYLAMLGVK